MSLFDKKVGRKAPAVEPTTPDPPAKPRCRKCGLDAHVSGPHHGAFYCQRCAEIVP